MKRIPDHLAEAMLDEMYEGMPVVKCKGLCADQCTSISMSDVEMRRVRRTYGIHIPRPTAATIGKPCPALKDGRCTVYPLRPYICRVYGTTRGTVIDCQHGCEIVGKPWTNRQVSEGLAWTYAIGGGQLARAQQEAFAVIQLIRSPEGQRIVDLGATKAGRLTLAREHINRTVLSPLPRGTL